MSVFKVNLITINPKSPEKLTLPIEVLVDTGAELTWFPRDVLVQIAIEPVRKRAFITANKQIV